MSIDARYGPPCCLGPEYLELYQMARSHEVSMKLMVGGGLFLDVCDEEYALQYALYQFAAEKSGKVPTRSQASGAWYNETPWFHGGKQSCSPCAYMA